MGIAKTNANSRTKNKSRVRFIKLLFMSLYDQIVKLLVDRKTLTYYFNYMNFDASLRTFDPFSLTRLLTKSFGSGTGERVCVLIDLPNPEDIKDYAFLNDETLSIQNYGYEVFYKGFQNGALEEMNWKGGEIFAYKETGGSNLDMEDEIISGSTFTHDGKIIHKPTKEMIEGN